MKALGQVFFILLFYALGEGLSRLMRGFLPGSVLGMLLLFAVLELRWISPDWVRDSATFLTRNMGIFFVPAGVGLVTQWAHLEQYWFPILLSMTLSTALVMAVVALVQQQFEKYKDRQFMGKDKAPRAFEK